MARLRTELQLSRVRRGAPGGVVAGDEQFDVFAKGSAQQALHPGEKIGHVNGARVQGLATRKGQKLAGKPRSTLARRTDHFRQLCHRWHSLVLINECLGGADNDCEKVVEVVCNAAGKPTDRFHFLRLPQLLFAGEALAHVSRDAKQCAVLRRPYRRPGDRNDRSVLVNIPVAKRGRRYAVNDNLLVCREC
jgi:hypothetical protein